MMMTAGERLYPIRRPVAAAAAGAAVAILGGLIGLGGAEFRLPLLITVFAVFAHRAIRINLLISLATLAMSAVARVGFLNTANVAEFRLEIFGMLAGGILAAWIGAGYLKHIPKGRITSIIAALLLATGCLLAVETTLHGMTWSAVPQGSQWTLPLAILAGLFVGAISSLLGVAGGEFIIPILIFMFGADIRTAGTASVMVSIPIVLTGVVRHWTTGHYQSHSMLAYLVLPMVMGSIVGALIGGYLAASAPTDALRLVLGTILAASAIKLWSKPH